MPLDQSPGQASPEAAAAVVRDLLLRSFVCAVGLRLGLPTVLFAKNQPGGETELQIESSWSLSPPVPVPARVTEEQRDLVLLADLDGRKVVDVELSGDSSLTIRFEDGLSLRINGTSAPGTAYEPWSLSQILRPVLGSGARVVARAGSGFSVRDAA